MTINGQGQAVLDLGAAAGTGQENFLADYGDGTLVQFVQDFDISAANGQLGALASSAVFHERPGMELDYSGDIVLSSNWNLGAGTVDVAGAVAAGLMAELPTVEGKYYVLPGREADVFQNFTTMVYRTGGAVDGEPGMLTLRAGGTLYLNGSITDGFFQFRDQTDPDYLNMMLGGGNKQYTPFLATGCSQGDCNLLGDWQTNGLPGNYVLISIPGAGDLKSFLFDPAPYSAAANSPAAVGSPGQWNGRSAGQRADVPAAHQRRRHVPCGRVVVIPACRRRGFEGLVGGHPERRSDAHIAGRDRQRGGGGRSGRAELHLYGLQGRRVVEL